ncbi:MAG: hypothetical protein ACLPX8_22725 [Bryobacteraceae bacterium]
MNDFGRRLDDMTSREPATAKLALMATLVAAVPTAFDVDRETAAVGLTALVLAPMLIVWMRTKRLIVADPLLIIGMLWILAAALPVLMPLLYTDAIWGRLSSEMLETAELWMYRGWAACSVVYWLIRAYGQARRQRARRLDNPREDRLRWLVGLVGLFGSVGITIVTRGQGYSFIDTKSEPSSFGMVLTELNQFAVFYLFLHFQARGRGRLTRREPSLLLAVLAAQAAIVVAAGSKGVVLQLLAAWFMGNAGGGSRVGFMKELAVGVLALAAVYFTFEVITQFRFDMLGRDVELQQSFTDALSVQLDAMGTAIGQVMSGETVGAPGQEYGVGNILDRLGYVSEFATLLEKTGGQSPYEHSLESLAAPVVALMPRDLMADKVHFFNSGDFAKILGWDFGGFAVTLPGSFYWAWGYAGILAGMAMLGACLALLANHSNSDGVGGVFIQVLMLREVMMMLDVGKEFQPVVIGMVRTSMFLFALAMLSRLFRTAHPFALRRRSVPLKVSPTRASPSTPEALGSRSRRCATISTTRPF